LIFVASLFLVFTNAITYQVIKAWTGGATSCSGGYQGLVVVNASVTCTSAVCACTSSGCSTVECLTSIPADPANAVVAAQYSDATCSSGIVSFYAAATNGACFPGTANFTTSGSYNCANGQFSQNSYTNGGCTGTPSSVTGPFALSGTVCASGLYFRCPSATCFHKDTVVNYHDKKVSFETLKDETAEVPCTIPHVYQTEGVKITTTCEGVLRLTHEHLVMTENGWKAAGLLQVGDKLYSKVHSSTSDCEVTHLETEKHQEYFALNCEDSDVEANGYWVSTFGIQHRIPAMWMKAMSKVVGIKRASQIGDFIATKLNHWGFI